MIAAWPLANAKACRAAIERRQALFQHIGGRVHQAGIDVAEFAQAEKIGGVLGIVKHVARRRIDRDGACRGCGIGHLARRGAPVCPACRLVHCLTFCVSLFLILDLYDLAITWRHGAESNRRWELCRLLPCHLATAPHFLSRATPGRLDHVRINQVRGPGYARISTAPTRGHKRCRGQIDAELARRPRARFLPQPGQLRSRH